MAARDSRNIEDRLEARRAGLMHFCEVEPVKQHLRLLGYYQLARQMIQQADAYVADGSWDEAYVYLARFIKICSKVIPAHRDYKKPWNEKEKQWIHKEAERGRTLFDRIMKGMEEDEIELMKEEEEQQRQTEARRPATPPPPPQPQPRRSSAPAAPPTLEERLAALRLRKEEDLQRQSAARTVEPRRLRATYTPVSGVRNLEPPEPRLARSTVAYPSVDKTHWMREPPRQEAPPPAPAQTRVPPIEQRRVVSRQQSQDAINYFSSGQLRTLEIPSSIINDFTVIAAPNTNRRPDGIETCGILAGKLHRNRLVITTLIIPKQRGSSDECTMTNEEELSIYCSGNELLMLGWIHTHPRQSCFLSSVDIHTQCGFQSMLAESIAIVVAPTDMRQNVGVFRLTQPGGMEMIQQCRLTGFHKHPEHIQIYSAALACEWNSQRRPFVVDMR